MRLLVIEDEKRLAQNLAELLRRQGYTVDVSSDGVSGYDNAVTDIYDLILLDAMLPGDGPASPCCEGCAPGGHAVPVLMLTARSDVADRVQGLDCGADYYLTNPSSPTSCWPASLPCCAGAAATPTDDAIAFRGSAAGAGTFSCPAGAVPAAEPPGVTCWSCCCAAGAAWCQGAAAAEGVGL